MIASIRGVARFLSEAAFLVTVVVSSLAFAADFGYLFDILASFRLQFSPE